MKNKSAFTLVEVVLAMGIMAVALLMAFGIITPLLAQTTNTTEANQSNRISDLIVAEVNQLKYDELIEVVSKKTKLFVSKDASIVALASDPKLDILLPEVNRHYEIQLSRNEPLSPASTDNTAGYFVYQITLTRIHRQPNGSRISSGFNETITIINAAASRANR